MHKISRYLPLLFLVALFPFLLAPDCNSETSMPMADLSGVTPVDMDLGADGDAFRPPPDQFMGSECTNDTMCTKERPACNNMTCFECAPNPGTDSGETYCKSDSGLACKSAHCDTCSLHSDCASKICDIYQINGNNKPGRCLKPAEVVYVDNSRACMGRPAGTLTDPFCLLPDAVSAVVNDLTHTKTSIRILTGTKPYDQIQLTSHKVSIFADPKDGVQLPVDKSQVGVTVSGTGDLTLNGLGVVNSNQTAIQCRDATAKLTLRQGWVTGSTQGIISGSTADATPGCNVTIERSRLSQNSLALYLGYKTVYQVTNSFIVHNTSGGADALIQMASSSSGTFQYNTVAANKSNSSGGINCGLFSRNIEDSIVWGNSVFLNSQFLGTCKLLKVVVGKGESLGGILEDPDFASPGPPDFNFHLASPSSCCVNHGTVNASIKTDFDGDIRPRSMPPKDTTGYDIGADQRVP